MSKTHLFGPVASRRLGRSLGVDLIPAKTCPLDCVYCEVGRTTRHSAAREHFYPADEILAELEEFFASGGEADFITITGSGEPTLSLELGKIVSECKRRFDTPVAVITNGVLLDDAEVRRELMPADLVMPSLDAARREAFDRVNRPADGVTLESVVKGLMAFANEYKGRLWLEVLLVAGMNDSDADIEALRDLIARIKPRRIQLNTIARPPADRAARPVAPEKLEAVAEALSKAAPVEIVAPGRVRAGHKRTASPREAILQTVRRRPCTLCDLAAGLILDEDVAQAAVAELLAEGSITAVEFDMATFYKAE